MIYTWLQKLQQISKHFIKNSKSKIDDMNANQPLDENTIVQCFIHIHSPTSTASVRKQADTYLIECEKYLAPLLKCLLSIFKDTGNKYAVQVRLQSLLYLSNVIKRNWNNKRLLKSQPQLPQLKRTIPAQLISMIQSSPKIFINSLYNIITFIAKTDYPHAFPQLTQFTLIMLSNIQGNQNSTRNFKMLRDIFAELGERKGYANGKSYQQGPIKILASLGPISQTLRQQMCKIQDVNPCVARLSKYCDQILICLIRIAPFSYLDDENFMIFIKHISNKLQTILTSHNSQTPKNRDLLQKDIKSIIYQLGCLQCSNPCILSPILSQYITILFYIISKPQLFCKPSTIKSTLISLRKLIKQFTYYSQNTIFEKSISNSQQKSNNYLQMRKIAHQIYKENMNQETVQGLFNFMLTNVMNIKEKGDTQAGIGVGMDDGYGGEYDRAVQKDMSVHVCGTLLVQALIQRFPNKMLSTLYNSLKLCLQLNFTNIDMPTLLNFLSILAIVPRSCKRSHTAHLAQFPILQVLQYVHSASSNSNSSKLREKFPMIISGWLDIFSNQQIGQLVQVLLTYVGSGAQQKNMDILLYSCYSLNRIVTLRSPAVNCGLILNKVFPVAITVFDHTDNPQILWPLINLISTLLTKCEFDTNIIVHSIQSNSLSSLISNQSQMLVQALCQMFKSFLCIIPRNKPAVAVFKLVYHFLDVHLAKTHALSHQKCVNLWYYAIREFSSVNQLNNQYYQLFQNHFKRSMFSLKPVLIYILQQYMLLGLIQSKLQTFISIVLQFYKQGQFIQTSQSLTLTSQPQQSQPQQSQQQSRNQQSTQLKIAALSFQITLLTKYSLQQINSQQMLYIIMKDFCTVSNGTDGKTMSTTLQNSILSIINRYIMVNSGYFFEFLKMKLDMTPPAFYGEYFRNMGHLTSRTAMKINALALISLLDKIYQHYQGFNLEGQLWFNIKSIIKYAIIQIENQAKNFGSTQNIGKIQNSPTIRFSQNILSQRKEQIRKQGTYDNINIRQYFLSQLEKCVNQTGMNLEQFINYAQFQQEWIDRLKTVYQ